MPNNFLQWNPNAVNQESDGAYSADSQRSGGAGTGQIFTSLLANKLHYQQSIMVAAIAAMMTDKGFSVNDGSGAPGSALATLKAVLANILTTADNTVPQRVAEYHVNNNSGALGSTLLYTVPASTYVRIYRLSWHARVFNAGGGGGNTIGPLTLTYFSGDNVSQSVIVPGYSRVGAFETTETGNTPTSILSGIPLIIEAKPSTNINFTWGYNWSGVNPQLSYEIYLSLEQLSLF